MSERAASALERHERAIAFAVIVALPVLAVLGLVYYEQRQRIESIQESRAEIAYTTCLEQNARHDATVQQLDAIVILRKAELRDAIREADVAGDVALAESLREQADGVDDSRATTASLIDALAPLHNCEQIVLDRFGEVPHLEGD